MISLQCFVGTFIEALRSCGTSVLARNFPSFLEGLSLRHGLHPHFIAEPNNFPSFSEGLSLRRNSLETALWDEGKFPFLFGRAFIEAPVILDSSARVE